jgi:hypothetical protein
MPAWVPRAAGRWQRWKERHLPLWLLRFVPIKVEWVPVMTAEELHERIRHAYSMERMEELAARPNPFLRIR